MPEFPESSTKGYYNTSVGDNPDVVFGYYMCRGDLQPNACYNCIVYVTQMAQDVECKDQGGIFLFANCIFRYTNHSTYGVLDTLTFDTAPLGLNVSNHEQYNKTLSSLINDLVNEAATESNVNNGIVPGFATKEATVTGEEKTYSLAQCTPDIVRVNCSMCLRHAFSDLKLSYERYQGEKFIASSCMLIYNNES